MNAIREVSPPRGRLSLPVLTFFFLSFAQAPAQCPKWGAGFGLPGPDAGVNAVGMFDDGTGASLFVGGDFTTVEGQPASHIAKWDGTSWTPLGSGLNETPRTFAVFDDGTGPALFVGGEFAAAGGVGTGGIARWDGTVWTGLGPGITGTVVALEVFDDGHGPALYAGGSFTVRSTDVSLANPNLRNIAKWDGTSWSALRKGTDGEVQALEVFNDGFGPKLYVGGTMQNAGGTGVPGLARWDGHAWSSIGGIAGGSGIFGLVKHQDGSGAALYAAGGFTEIGGVSASNVARWNGTTWSPVGSGLESGVEDLAVINPGGGAILLASLQTTVRRWDGATWTTLAPWPPHPGSPVWIPWMSTLHDGTSTSVYVGLQWSSFGGSGMHFVRWDGADWSLVGTHDGIPGGPNALAVLDQGAGPRLVAGGSFRHAGGSLVRRLSIFEGGEWSTLAGGTDGPVLAMAPLTSGGSQGLVVAGTFSEAGGTSVGNIALWHASAWQALAGGVDDDVFAVTVSQEMSGPILYAGGDFEMAGGSGAHHVARWDGSSWTALGSGVDGTISEMAIFDSGTGPDLYVAGDLTAAGGSSVSHIARWNGTAWSSLDTGVNGPVTAMAVADDGSGDALYVAGNFSQAGGVSAFRVARWDGAVWSPVGPFNSGFLNAPTVMTAFDDGSGPALFAMGLSPRGDPCRLWKWDGLDWSVESTVEAKEIRSLAVFDDGSDGTADLYSAGLIFQHFQPGIRPAAAGIARWDACPHAVQSFCHGGGPSFPCPCGNSGARGRGCDNSAATGGAELFASGSASLASDDLRLTSSGEPAGALSIFFQGDARVDSRRSTFGDGNRCTGGRLLRLYWKAARGDAVGAPGVSELGFAERSERLGDPLSAGCVRFYQVIYRDSDTDFCPSPLGNLWNTSNALRIEWRP